MHNPEHGAQMEALRQEEQDLLQKITQLEATNPHDEQLNALHARYDHVQEELSKFDHNDLQAAA